MAGNSAAQEQKIEGTSSTTAGLSPEQIRQFKEEGFLIVRQMLPLDAFQPLIDELAQKVDSAIGEAVRQGSLTPERPLKRRRFPSGWHLPPKPVPIGTGCGRTIFQGGSPFLPVCLPFALLPYFWTRPNP